MSFFFDYNEQSRDALLENAGKALGMNLTFQVETAFSPLFAEPLLQPMESFKARLDSIQKHFNLDYGSSGSSRHTYIATYLSEAIADVMMPGQITERVTILDGKIPHQLGFGNIDFLISDPAGNLYGPSTIVTIKKDLGNEAVGENELLAQMLTLAQLAPVKNFHGVLTDGRYWYFYQLLSTGNVYRSSRQDAERDLALILTLLARLLQVQTLEENFHFFIDNEPA